MRQTIDLDHLPAEVVPFLEEFVIATITTQRPDGSLHVAAIGFTYDESAKQCWLVAPPGSRKVRNIRAGSRAVVAQVEGSRWLSLEGPARLVEDAEGIAEAHRRYRVRYPGFAGGESGRIGIVIDVERMMGIPMRRTA